MRLGLLVSGTCLGLHRPCSVTGVRSNQCNNKLNNCDNHSCIIENYVTFIDEDHIVNKGVKKYDDIDCKDELQ